MNNPGLYRLANPLAEHYICGEMRSGAEDVPVSAAALQDQYVVHLIDTHQLNYLGPIPGPLPPAIIPPKFPATSDYAANHVPGGHLPSGGKGKDK